MRPTPEQIAEAQRVLKYADFPDIAESILDAIRTLMDATEPPTDKEIAAFTRNYPFAVTPRAICDHFLGPIKP